jgi:hypothetical protein
MNEISLDFKREFEPLVNDEYIARRPVWGGISRSVEAMDGFPAASMDGFTAVREMPPQTGLLP